MASTVFDADAAWLRRAAAERPADVNPWSLPGIYVTSIDFAKRAEVLRALEDVTWDVTVVDEAHLASASSDRRAAAHAVASRSGRMVLLTATPDAGDPAGFEALCRIGRVRADEPPVLFFRRSRADVSDGRPRRSRFLRVHPTDAERRMHELLDDYTRRVWTEAAAAATGARSSPPSSCGSGRCRVRHRWPYPRTVVSSCSRGQPPGPKRSFSCRSKTTTR